MSYSGVHLTQLCENSKNVEDLCAIGTAISKGAPYDERTLTIACERFLIAASYGIRSTENVRHSGDLTPLDHYLIWERIVVALVDKGAKTDLKTVEKIRGVWSEKLNSKIEKALPCTIGDEKPNPKMEMSLPLLNPKIEMAQPWWRKLQQALLEWEF